MGKLAILKNFKNEIITLVIIFGVVFFLDVKNAIFTSVIICGVNNFACEHT